MEKTDFFSKLKDEFLTLVVGVVIALPAIGIVVPQLFAILGDQQDQQISGSFKVFTMLYFAMPLILLFIWSFFQFSNSILRNMRPMIWTGVAVLAAVFVLLLIPLKSAGNNQQNVFRLLPWLIMLVLAVYWRFFLIAKRKLIDRISRIQLKLDALKSGDSEPVWTQEHKQEKIKIFAEKRAKALAAIKLMFFFLFIATHLVVVLLLILFNTIYNNVFQATVLISLYAAVLVYYRIDPDLGKLRNKSLLPESTFSALLGLAVISVAMVFYMSAVKPSGNTTKSFFDTSNSAYTHDFAQLDNAGKLEKYILALDSDYRQTVITSSVKSEKMLPCRYLRDLLSDTAVNKDTIAAFKMRMTRYGLLERNKIYKDSLESLWLVLRASPHDSLVVTSKLDSLYRLTAIEHTLKRAEYKQRVRKLQGRLQNIPAVSLTGLTLAADSAAWAGMQSANRQIRAIKLQQLTAESYQAIAKQTIIIKNTQRAGMVVFMTTLIIALAFLMILGYSDDLFHPETLSEVTAVRRSLQVVCLVIIILLIPLIKPVPESELDPAKPTALFLTANWNLAKAFKSTDETGAVMLQAKQRFLRASASDGTELGGDYDGTQGKNKCPKCCPDTMFLKFPPTKDTILTKLIEWSSKQQNERKTIDSLYLVALNRLNQPRDNGQLAFLQSYLDEIRRTLSDSRQYNLQTHVAVDSAIRELDTIQKVLERSSYKTTFNSLRK